MPLLTRASNHGNLYQQATEPAGAVEGDVWYDTVNDVLKVYDGASWNGVGSSSFSAAAAVTHSEDILDYSDPAGGVATSEQTTGYNPTITTSGTFSLIPSTLDNAKNGSFASGTAGGTVNNITPGTNQEIRADFGSIQSARTYTVKCFIYGTGGSSIVWNLEYSDDGVTWYSADTYSHTVNDPSTTWTTTTASISCRYLRIRLDRIGYVYTFLRVYEFQDDTLAAHLATDVTNDELTNYWESDSEANPAVYIDCESSKNILGLAIYLHANNTETSVKLRVSSDTTFTDGENTRTVLVSGLTAGDWNYIRFNLKKGQYIQVYGASGSSLVLAISQIKYLTKTDSEILQDLGILEISNSDTSIGLDGV